MAHKSNFLKIQMGKISRKMLTIKTTLNLFRPIVGIHSNFYDVIQSERGTKIRCKTTGKHSVFGCYSNTSRPFYFLLFSAHIYLSTLERICEWICIFFFFVFHFDFIIVYYQWLFRITYKRGAVMGTKKRKTAVAKCCQVKVVKTSHLIYVSLLPIEACSASNCIIETTQSSICDCVNNCWVVEERGIWRNDEWRDRQEVFKYMQMHIHRTCIKLNE